MNVTPRVCDLPATLARLGDNAALVRELLELFREDAPVFQSRLTNALSHGDFAGVARASHSLSGMLTTFGAEAAMQIAQCLERMGQVGDLTGAKAQNEKLGDEISR